MNHFDYRNGVLHAEAVDLFLLAVAVGTPLYSYFPYTPVSLFPLFRALQARQTA